MAFRTYSYTDPSICKMGLKNSGTHILTLWVFYFKPKISKKPDPEDTRVQQQVLHSPCSHLYFTPQISQPTRPFAWDLPGFSNSSPSSWETPLIPGKLGQLVTQQAIFYEPSPRTPGHPTFSDISIRLSSPLSPATLPKPWPDCSSTPQLSWVLNLNQVPGPVHLLVLTDTSNNYPRATPQESENTPGLKTRSGS